MNPAEKVLFETYVTKYAEKLRQIYDLYQEKVGLLKLESVEEASVTA